MTLQRTGSPAAALALSVLVLSCGGGAEVDTEGLVRDRDALTLFARASQQYFRGSLSDASESFNGVAYGHPGSPLADDARLAARRIDAELSGSLPSDTAEAAGGGGEQTSFPSIALVGKPSVSSALDMLQVTVSGTGSPPVVLEDPGAPDITLVLYPPGMEPEAQIVADSLASWLSSHSSVPVQPAGEMTEAIAPGHQGVLVVVGSDAVLPTAAATGGTR